MTVNTSSSGFRIDLHTHSYGSPDGSLTTRDYQRIFSRGQLQYCAITDHDTITAALAIQAELGEYAKRIIIGEEISSLDGEIIGLYLTELIPAGLTALATVRAIKAQGGLVYLPHPFETVRSGIGYETAHLIRAQTDIIEIHNGRAIFQNRSHQAVDFARHHGLAGASASDSHGRLGWGRAYSQLPGAPTQAHLVSQLQQAKQITGYDGIGMIYPKLNRVRKAFKARPGNT